MTNVTQVAIEYQSNADRVAREHDQLTGAAKRSGRAVAGVERSAKSAAAGLQRAGAQARAVQRPMQVAGGHAANMTAQFNDIGVMLASGQSPFLLATQQGTQVGQVFQQMRAQGVGALQGMTAAARGLASMLGPVAAIFAVGAVVNWAREMGQASEETATFEDALSGALSVMQEYRRHLDFTRDNLDGFTAAQLASNQAVRDSIRLRQEESMSALRARLTGQAANRESAGLPGAVPGFAAAGGAQFAAEILHNAEQLTAQYGEQIRIATDLDASADARAAAFSALLAAGKDLELSTEQRVQFEQIIVDLTKSEVAEAERLAEAQERATKAVQLRQVALTATGRRGLREPGSVREAVGRELEENARIRRAGFDFVQGPLDRQAGSVYAEAKAELEAALAAPGGWAATGALIQQTMVQNVARALATGDWDNLGLIAFNSISQALIEPFLNQGIGALTGLLGFDTGGTVPGPPGQPRLAVVHGQEKIRTPMQERALQAGVRGGDDNSRTTFHQVLHVTGDVNEATRRAVRHMGREIGDLAIARIAERRLI